MTTDTTHDRDVTEQSCDVWLEPLNCPHFLSSLKSFRSLLESCVGSQGCTKILVSGGGCLTVTSSSSRLVEKLTLNNPILVVIANIMKNQLKQYSDCGLYVGVMSVSLLEHVLISKMPHTLASELINSVISKCVDMLESVSCTQKIVVHFETVKHILPIVQTILKSKPACNLSQAKVKFLSIQIVKAFLQTIPNLTTVKGFGHVSVIYQEGLDIEDSVVFSGVLYPAPDIDQDVPWDWTPHVPQSENMSGIMVALFSMMLTNINDLEEGADFSYETSLKMREHNAVVDKVLLVSEQLIRAGVCVFACQKVIHPRIRQMLQKNSVLVLERLGFSLARSLERLSGAIPISSFSVQDIASCLGRLDSVEHVVQHGKSYLLLNRKNADVVTLLVHNLNEESKEELKVVTQQALNVLGHLLVKPVVLPGAGCLEMWLSSHLHTQVMADKEHICNTYGCSTSQLLTAIGWVQTSLLGMCKCLVRTDSLLVTDSVYQHVWPVKKNGLTQDGNCCACGMVTRYSVQEQSGEWTEVLDKTVPHLETQKPSNTTTPSRLQLNEDATVDIYTCKLNALKLAVDTCQNVASIGMIMYRKIK